MTKQEKQGFLNAGGTAIRLDINRLMIKAKTKDKDWHNFKKCITVAHATSYFKYLLNDKNYKTW